MKKHKVKKGDDIYPLTVIKSRYSGCYSGGEYLAFNLSFYDLPEEILGDDIECGFFFGNEGGYERYLIGKGQTPEDAVLDLKSKL